MNFSPNFRQAYKTKKPLIQITSVEAETLNCIGLGDIVNCFAALLPKYNEEIELIVTEPFAKKIGVSAVLSQNFRN